MLQKNQIYEAVISDYTVEGQGVARIEGCAVFVPNAIAGERCRIRIEKVGKTWASGKIVEILEKSEHRMNRACPVAKLCGGCDFWHMDYEEESRLKAQRVRDCLNRIGGETLEDVPILAAPTCRGYRNKAQYPVAAKKNKAFAGFFKAGSHQVVENDRCLILPQETDRVKDIVIDYVNQTRVSVYDEATHTGLLRHIYVRRGAVSGQILVCLAVNGRVIPKPERLVEKLKAVPGFTTLVLSVNTKKGNTVLGDEEIVLYGPGYIEDTMCSLNFRLSPRSFYQVNHHQAQRLYESAIAQAQITRDDTVLDLYCGVGTITLCMAKAAGKVIGVEVVPQAVEDAKANAKRNGIDNAEFFCGDAGQAALALEQQGIKADVAVVDPPRKGLNADTIEALARMSPRRIVYVSCDPATLARDVALLKDRGYRLKNALAADLFPRCSHVESIVCLTKEQTVHEMKLKPSPFEKIKSGQKTIELRLYDEKRQQIKVGDGITFTNTSTGEQVRAIVRKLHRFDSFAELYRTLPLLQCGYTAEDVDKAHPSDMEQYYSTEEQEKYGVVGIELCVSK
ncbi:MAG: 23S rRNA (uracil(1939)-C(5))-methyltransferase RlmD [Ruminococcaceae bacterium]|nr:23S rRNA (uracil(1939)-C(5))-methyltransferase RlmD [Oscillospiraceae bacterium]